MKTKVFKCGNSQAVRLPKGFTFDCEEVEIFKRNDEIVLRAVPQSLRGVVDLFAQLPDDFFADGREDTPPQERDEW